MPTPDQSSNEKRGGRPPKDYLKHLILYIVKELRLANVSLIKAQFERNSEQNTSINTIRKYADALVDDGLLWKSLEIDNKGQNGKRSYKMALYRLV